MSQFVKGNIKYIFLFVFFFFCLQFLYSSFQGDLIYNFGFSYAVSRGEIPYKDFNMIVPPFGAFLYAIPFVLFGNSLIVLNLFQSFLLCVLFYFIFKLYRKNGWILLLLFNLILPIPFVTALFPGYNFLLLLEIILLIYLEKNNGNDYLIGLILGLSILTKQTVGFCFCLVSFYYLFKDYKKILRRMLGFLIPCVLFLIYLLFTGSLVNFFDMCLFGMFDFTSKNGKIMDYNFILYLVLLCFLIYRILKNKKDINNYYSLAFSIIAIPLFDYYHVALAVLFVLILLFDKIKLKSREAILAFNCFLFAISTALAWFGLKYNFAPNITSFNNFEGKVMSIEIENSVNEINKFIIDNKEQNLIILGANAYFFKITNDLDINHYDLLNYGNHGYDGTNKVINQISKEKNPIFIINLKEYEDNSSDRQQINKTVMEYVFDNYKLTKKIGEYVIYEDDR